MAHTSWPNGSVIANGNRLWRVDSQERNVPYATPIDGAEAARQGFYPPPPLEHIRPPPGVALGPDRGLPRRAGAVAAHLPSEPVARQCPASQAAAQPRHPQGPPTRARDHGARIPRARDAFLAEACEWARRINVTPKEIRLHSMARKWDSCSTNGHVTFDLALLRQSPELRRRAVVEELLHLRVPDHEKLFKALLKAHLET